jgi:hypothetical protein
MLSLISESRIKKKKDMSRRGNIWEEEGGQRREVDKRGYSER